MMMNALDQLENEVKQLKIQTNSHFIRIEKQIQQLKQMMRQQQNGSNNTRRRRSNDNNTIRNNTTNNN